jgi:hypothetical protein
MISSIEEPPWSFFAAFCVSAAGGGATALAASVASSAGALSVTDGDGEADAVASLDCSVSGTLMVRPEPPCTDTVAARKPSLIAPTDRLPARIGCWSEEVNEKRPSLLLVALYS